MVAWGPAASLKYHRVGELARPRVLGSSSVWFGLVWVGLGWNSGWNCARGIFPPRKCSPGPPLIIRTVDQEPYNGDPIPAHTQK